MENRRWLILGLLFAASVINFVDRQTVSILARTIQNELGISDLGYSEIVQAFLFAYMVAFLGAGWVTDRLGTRVGMTLFIVWWSLANMLTSLAGSVRSLGAARFLLGAGEAGLYTVAPKVVSQLFRPEQRGFAVGVYTAGATVGATLAPPLVAWLALQFGWRSAFIATGVLGLLWVVPWLIWYRADAAKEAVVPRTAQVKWSEVLRSPAVLLLLLGRVITDPVWHFILFWFPKYLTDVQHMALAEIGRIAWIVYLAADVGSVAGGALSGRLIRRGYSPPDARRWVMTGAAALIPLCALTPFLESRAAIVGVVAIVAMAHLTWMVTLTTLAVDLFPAEKIGTIFGVIAAGSGLGGMLFTNLVGRLVTSFSYTPVFILMSGMHPVALLLIWRVVKLHRLHRI